MRGRGQFRGSDYRGRGGFRGIVASIYDSAQEEMSFYSGRGDGHRGRGDNYQGRGRGFIESEESNQISERGRGIGQNETFRGRGNEGPGRGVYAVGP